MSSNANSANETPTNGNSCPDSGYSADHLNSSQPCLQDSREETGLFTSAVSNPVRDGQSSLFVPVPQERIQEVKPRIKAENETAIDHKIEQAMDLVKNHLLFAVREEIELLKKQIVDLMNRNQQLEIENEFLRSMALPETLNEIEQQQQQQVQQQLQEQQQTSVAIPQQQPIFL